MRPTIAAFALLIAFSSALDGASRRRAVSRQDLGELPYVWLSRHAHPLTAMALPAPSTDLEPLRELAGDASVVALGDGTHGTREFYTLKLRMIDFLVREMGFDVVAFEAPFPLFDRLNAYVMNGVGDPRAILLESNDRLYYRFWAVDEMLAVVEWMRSYNLTRGDRPPLQIAGADVYDGVGAVQAVLAFLRAVDPAAAAEADAEYACVSALPNDGCGDRARMVLERLTAKRAEYQRVAGAGAFAEAEQNARVVVQANAMFGERDRNMASNVEWLLANRSTSRRMIFWAHQEHVGKTVSRFVPGPPSGAYLADRLGPRYVAIGSMAGGGTYRYWRNDPFGEPATARVPPPAEGTYESLFRLREAAALMIPLNGDVPSWLAGPANHFVVGTSASDRLTQASLPEKLDAVVYIEFSSPTQPLRR